MIESLAGHSVFGVPYLSLILEFKFLYIQMTDAQDGRQPVFCSVWSECPCSLLCIDLHSYHCKNTA